MDLHRVALLCTFFCFAQVWSRPTNCILREDLLKRSYTVIETAVRIIAENLKWGLFPVQCLDENVVIPFPQNAFESDNTDQVTGVEKSVYQTLENINALFEKFEDYTGPDQRFTENWNEFRGLVYRQIKESKCIKSEAAQDFPSREASLKVYFETITSTLKEKDFSYCAWEIVRKEILHTLKFILDVNSNVKFLR